MSGQRDPRTTSASASRSGTNTQFRSPLARNSNNAIPGQSRQLSTFAGASHAKKEPPPEFEFDDSLDDHLLDLGVVVETHFESNAVAVTSAQKKHFTGQNLGTDTLHGIVVAPAAPEQQPTPTRGKRSPDISPAKRLRPALDPDSPFVVSNNYMDAPEQVVTRRKSPGNARADMLPPLNTKAAQAAPPITPRAAFLSPVLRSSMMPLPEFNHLNVQSPMKRGSPEEDEDGYLTCPSSPSTPSTSVTLFSEPQLSAASEDPSLVLSPGSSRRGYGIKTPKLSDETENRLGHDGFTRLFEVLRHLAPSGPIRPDLVDSDAILLDELVSCPLFNIASILESRIPPARRSHTALLQAPDKAFAPPDFQLTTFAVTISRTESDTGNVVVSLDPPSADLATRLQAYCGQDNILVVSLDNDKIHNPSLVKPSLRNITLGGRIFQFLLNKSDNRDGSRAFYYSPIPDLPTSAVLAWLVPPIPRNMKLTLPKYLARLTLSVSRTHRIPIPDARIEVIDDIERNGHCFTDGCSLISPDLFREICVAVKAETNPYAIQVRLGGAKGVLLSDHRLPERTIRLRKSMVKYYYPGDQPVGEGQARVLEVLKVADESLAYLNQEYVEVLAGLGVTKDSLTELEHEAAAETLEQLFPDPPNGMLTARFLARSMNHHCPLDEKDPYTEELLFRLILAGFDPTKEPWARQRLIKFSEQEAEKRRSKARILVRQGCSAIMVPDPYGVLAEGELCYTGDKGPLLGEVLAMRNPCHLPSDIQVYRGVSRPELAGYRNVCLFSTAGEGPSMAAQLSGGDYDGDVVTLVWDPRLVGPFSRAHSEVLSEFPEVTRSFERRPPPTIDTIVRKDSVAEDLLDTCWAAYCSGNESKLGLYSRWHAIVAEHRGIGSRDAIELAQMCQRLVDAPKSGDRLLEEAYERHKQLGESFPSLYWWAVRQSNKSKSKKPARPAPTRDPSAASDRATSFLYDLAAGLVPLPPRYEERIQKLREESSPMDRHLMLPLEEAESVNDPTDATAKDLAWLTNEVKKLRGRWGSHFAALYMATTTTPLKEASVRKRKTAEMKQITEVEFRNLGKTSLQSLYFANKEVRLKVLGALAYRETRQTKGSPNSKRPDGSGQFCWDVAFDILCGIKAAAVHNDDGQGGQRELWKFPWMIPASLVSNIRVAKQR